MSFPESGSPQSGTPSNVVIPPLERQQGGEELSNVPRSVKKSRALNACKSCRGRKTKCDRQQPRCQNCFATDKPCVYPQSRKNRLKRAMKQNQDTQQIEHLLAQAKDVLSDVSAPLCPPPPVHHGGLQRKADLFAEVSSNTDSDMWDEDILRNGSNRATRLPECEHPYKPPGNRIEASLQRGETLKMHHQPGFDAQAQTTASAFYLDDDSAPFDRTVSPSDLPPRQIAQRLLDNYMTVQDSFPILSETLFKRQFNQYYTAVLHGTPLAVPRRWLAVLNLVFAIGASYLHLTEAYKPTADLDHHVYWSRAHILGPDGFSLVDLPDLVHVQITALAALYLLSVGHATRAWIAIGSSLRYANALGLHVRNDGRTSTTFQNEILLRIWWGIYSLEGVISTLVGRSGYVLDGGCSAPLPLPLATEQLSDETLMNQCHERYRGVWVRSNSPQMTSKTAEPCNAGSYLKSRIQIGEITQRAMTELYSTTVVTKCWPQVQQSITCLSEELEAWSVSLPSNLNFALPNADISFQRERMILELHYIGTKIHITRPCLCRSDSRVANLIGAPENFNKRKAQICVGGARAIANLLPDNFAAAYVYKTGPWWSVVPNLMQGLIVLLLEMSFGTVVYPEDGGKILVSVKKLIRCLRTMMERNKIAGRAYTLAFRVLKKIASKVNADISDLILEDTAPAQVTRTSNLEGQSVAAKRGGGD